MFNELIQILIISVLISNEANIIALSHKQEIDHAEIDFLNQISEGSSKSGNA